VEPSGSFASSPLGSNGIAIDGAGDIYLAQEGIRKYVNETFDLTLDASGGPAVFADQSNPSGHIFTQHDQSFNEYEPSGSLLGSYGNGGAIDHSDGIAYDHSLDHVYVGDRGQHVIRVFGSPVSGVAPDPTLEPTDGIGIGKATFHGTVNPQGVPNAYYFEWTDDLRPHSWREVQRSPLLSLPEDSSAHAVSFTSLNLRGNTTYRVRLIGVNTEKGLHAASSVEEFVTEKQTQLPPVTIDPIEQAPTAPCTIGVGTGSACVSGTINPLEETTAWIVETSTDPECKQGFVGGTQQSLLGEGRNAPVQIHLDLSPLLPAQHYCARIVATNSFGRTESTVEQFTTRAVPPDEVSTASAAPRSDTTARINGRVNPEGEAPLTYRFELSRDGTDWTVLPLHVSTIGARVQIVVAQELSGLEPGNTYHYRFGLVENEGIGGSGGSAASLGEEKTFTTRTAVEARQPGSCPNQAVRAAQHATYLHDCRGIELINNPDKAVQNVIGGTPSVGTSPISADGGKVFWRVAGGAPGGPNGTKSVFLAERTPAGWRSESIVPPAERQIEGGELSNEFIAATPDLETYVLNEAHSTVLGAPDPPTLLRIHRGGEEELLKRYEVRPINNTYESLLDLTDDGRHVLFVDNKTHQLEDIGAAGAPETISLMPASGLPSACGLIVGEKGSFARNEQSQPGLHWIASTDASRVYFQAPPDGNCTARTALYVRNREAGETTLIDAGISGHAPEFIRTTPDGREAYFLTYSKLDPADSNDGGDVYRWEEGSKTSVCLTCVVADADIAYGLGRAAVVSDDFSHIYFESQRQLVPGQGEAGDANLYVLNGGQVRFVADYGDFSSDGVLDGPPGPGVSRDGNVLAFLAPASQQLTADAMSPQCVELRAGRPFGHCAELYLYDDRDRSLECASCNREGVTSKAVGAASLVTLAPFRASGDGSTVAFVSEEGLVPRDVNRGADVYEWRNGSLGLVSNGVSTFQAGTTTPRVIGLDGDGSDIVFSLVPPGRTLTGFEQDELLNLYDARIDGGFEPPSALAHCIEDSCQGPLQAAPVGQSVASTGITHGNAAGKKPRCRKGKVRRRGRCVARRHHRQREGRRRAGRAQQGRIK
jgi:hypothetical protein